MSSETAATVLPDVHLRNVIVSVILAQGRGCYSLEESEIIAFAIREILKFYPSVHELIRNTTQPMQAPAAPASTSAPSNDKPDESKVIRPSQKQGLTENHVGHKNTFTVSAEHEATDKEKENQTALDKERAEQVVLEQQRLEEETRNAQMAQQQAMAEKAERERVEREQAERERVEREQAERERVEREQAELERVERERVEREQMEKQRGEIREKLEKFQKELNDAKVIIMQKQRELDAQKAQMGL
jgi:hypothetical protein